MLNSWQATDGEPKHGRDLLTLVLTLILHTSETSKIIHSYGKDSYKNQSEIDPATLIDALV